MRLRHLACLIVSASSLAIRAHAQTIDQYTTGNIHGFSNAQWWVGQEFHPSRNNSAGAGLYLWARGAAVAGTLDVQLWHGLSADGLLEGKLAESTTTFLLGAGSAAWIDAFWNSVEVDPARMDPYVVMFRVTNPPSTTFENIVTNYSASAYPNGSIVYNYSEDVNSYMSTWDTYDLLFEEYSGADVTTPEPASIFLLATGLVSVGLVRRRSVRSKGVRTA